MQYSRISADCHIDMPWIPNDLFTANASTAMRERMPFVADGPDGPHWTCKNGTSFGLVGGVGPGGAKLVPLESFVHRPAVLSVTPAPIVRLPEL